MTAILIIVLGIFFLGGVTLFVSALLAPEGHEDADGFHARTPTRVAWPRSPLTKSGQESPSLNI